MLSHASSLRLSSGHSGQVLTLRTNDAARTFPFSPCSWVAHASIWATSPLAVSVRCLFSGLLLLLLFFNPPSYVALSPQTCLWESFCYLETSPPSWVPPEDGSPSSTLFSVFIFCPTSFWREWAAFLGAWCPLPTFRSCSVEVAQHSNDLLMNLWGRKWCPWPISPPSWDCPRLLLCLWKESVLVHCYVV